MKQELIENALKLTGKTMEDIEEYCVFLDWRWRVCDWEFEFSIKNFCYYLHSPEFIEKYGEIDNDWLPQVWYAKSFWTAIYEYQSGNENPLEDLLSKICQ